MTCTIAVVCEVYISQKKLFVSIALVWLFCFFAQILYVDKVCFEMPPPLFSGLGTGIGSVRPPYPYACICKEKK
jgi:hypothetical protein